MHFNVVQEEIISSFFSTRSCYYIIAKKEQMKCVLDDELNDDHFAFCFAPYIHRSSGQILPTFPIHRCFSTSPKPINLYTQNTQKVYAMIWDGVDAVYTSNLLLCLLLMNELKIQFE